MKRILGPALSLALLLAVPACGYRLAGPDSARLPSAEIKSLAVPLARNLTIEAGLEDLFTMELIRALRADGRVPVVEPGRAATELRCSLTGLATRSAAYDESGRELAAQYSFKARCRLVAVSSGAEVWDTGELSAAEEYPVGNDPLQNEAAREAAFRKSCAELADTVRALLLDSF